jgi:hypothetical protein
MQFVTIEFVLDKYMPVATRSFPVAIPATITQSSLLAGIREALVTAGFPSPLKQYTIGTDLFCVWRLVFDATKAAGTAFYRLKVTSGLVVTHTVGSGFADATNALSGALTDFHAVTFSANFPVNFAGFQSSELVLALATQGSTTQFNAGYLRLQNAPQFDDQGFCNLFLSTSNVFTSLSTITPSPYGSTASWVTSLNATQMQDPDPLSQERSIEAPFKLWNAANTGIMCWSSPELGMGANASMSMGSLHIPSGTTEEWYATRQGAGTLIIRIK